ncbi:protoporphyrinogen oxidase [Calidifontibacter terrae]
MEWDDERVGSIVVIGAGIAGLSAAWELAQRGGHDVVVLESTERVGGKLKTGEVAGVAVDLGAESMLARRPEATQLLAELGLQAVAPATLPAAIWSRGEMHPMPRGTLMGVPADPQSLAGLLTDAEVARAATEEPVEVGDDISVGDLVERALGPAVVDRLVEPLLGGVYAGDARRLSAKACVRPLFDAVRSGSSLVAAARAATARPDDPRPVFAGLRGGVGTLPQALRKALQDKGIEVQLGQTVTRMERQGAGWLLRLADGSSRPADAVTVAIPAAPAARLLGPVCEPAADALRRIDYASMAIVTYAFRSVDLPDLPQRSGFLVPPPDGRRIKASTFSSRKWPWLAQDHPDLVFARVSIGRAGEVRGLQQSDEVLIRDGFNDLQDALGPLPDPVDAHLQRWGGALPQYAVGHVELVAGIRDALSPLPSLAVAGAAYDGVGIPACIGSGRTAAMTVLTALNEPTREGIHG